MTAPGLEDLTATEMTSLGVVPGVEETGGLTAAGSLADLYRLNLHLRTASRVLLRVADFRAATFGELERRAGALAWERWLAPDARATFRVTCRKSRLYHSGAVAERLERAAASRVGSSTTTPRPRAREAAPFPGGTFPGGSFPGGTSPGEASPDDPPLGGVPPSERAPAQRFIVRLVRDRLTLSLDASGEHLHRRGYRHGGAKAPLRETLAAAVLAASGWTPAQALFDPLCGSGTLVLEAGLRARRIAPGLARAFAFETWPGFDEALWQELRQSALERVAERAPAPLVGADRDEGAIRTARENARRAGVEDDVEFRRAPISEARPPAGCSGGGWLVTNPPYGHRLGEGRDLRDLYARLGQVARAHFPGWGVAVLTTAPELAGQVDRALAPGLTSRNGPLPVRLYTHPA